MRLLTNQRSRTINIVLIYMKGYMIFYHFNTSWLLGPPYLKPENIEINKTLFACSSDVYI